MRITLPISVLIAAAALLPAGLAWSGRPLWALAAAAAAIGAGSAWLRRRLAVPFEELGRGVKRWIYCDLDVPLDALRMADWPALASDFNKAQAEVSQILECRREEVAQERTKVETLCASIPDGLVILNLRGEIQFLNQAAVDMLGVAPHDVRSSGRGVCELTSPDIHRMQVQEILKNNTTCDVVEMNDPRGLKPSRFYRTAVKMFSMPEGGDFGVMLILRDITGERQLDAMKEEFFQHVAHDMRAPLFAMQGYLRLLEKAVQPAGPQKTYFESIAKSCDKLMLYINDTLDAARIEAGHFQIKPSPVDPRHLVARAAELFGPMSKDRDITLETRLPDDAPERISADERLLERVLSNLLSNALKFTPRGGRITVALARAGAEQVDFSVTDTGPGIPSDQKTRIFEKFRQAQEGHARLGFGLGLAICKKIVQLHDGSMWVESELGTGSQFVFRIPISRATGG